MNKIVHFCARSMKCHDFFDDYSNLVKLPYVNFRCNRLTPTIYCQNETQLEWPRDDGMAIRVCDWWFLNFKPQNMEPITFIWLGYKEIKTNCYHSVNVCISYISYFVKYSKLSKLSDELILNASLVQYLSVK